jgi:hypothetical protein
MSSPCASRSRATIRPLPARRTPPLHRSPNAYAGAFAGRAQVAPGPAITLAWTGYFVLLAIIANGRAYAHIRTTCVFALIGLVGCWIDAAHRQDDGAGGHSMRRRLLVIGGTLMAAAIYFRLWPGA